MCLIIFREMIPNLLHRIIEILSEYLRGTQDMNNNVFICACNGISISSMYNEPRFGKHPVFDSLWFID